MGKIVKGRDLMCFIKSGSTYQSIAYATNHTLSITADAIDASNKDEGAWGKQLTSKLNWEMTTENLFSTDPYQSAQYTYDELFDAMIQCKELEICFALADGNEDASGNPLSLGEKETDWTNKTPIYKGKAVITSLEANASDGEMATFSATFTGSGAITKA